MKDFSRFEPGDYLRIPWKRRWYFLGAFILVIASGCVYAWLRPELYRSETRILVESATILDEPLASQSYSGRVEQQISAIRQLLESRSILERIIEEFRRALMIAAYPWRMRSKESVPTWEVARAASGGSTFTMAYYATDPQAAQAITRRLAEILIQANQTSQKNRAIDKDQFLDQELTQAKLDSAAADEKIRQFKAMHLGELPEQSAANMNALSGLQAQLAALSSALDRDNDQKKVLEFRLREQLKINALSISLAETKQGVDLSGAKDAEAASPLSNQLEERRTQLAQMTARYTEKHPDVVRLSREVKDLEDRLAAQKAETGRTKASELTPLGPSGIDKPSELISLQNQSQPKSGAEIDIAQVRYELDILKETIERRKGTREDIDNIELYQNRLNLAPALEQELMALTRDHETKREQVANLEARKFNSQMAANAMTNTKYETYRILDGKPSPKSPCPRRTCKIILISILAAFGAGIGGAFAREFFEPSLASEDEALAVLKLPVLVSIPEIPVNPRAA